MAAFPRSQLDTLHEDMIHDAQYDYYATKLATCSSDRSVKIFDVVGEVYHCCATLTGHEGPVWQVAWAHPQNGVLLASCSYDGSVIIHKEQSQNNWVRVYEHRVHESSVNSISWAPYEFGLILACASSDGRISILEYSDEQRNWCVPAEFLLCFRHPLLTHPPTLTTVKIYSTGTFPSSKTTFWVATPCRGRHTARLVRLPLRTTRPLPCVAW
jgi:WD40 repeat protein